ncbi:MAG: HNH endonuclease [Streptomycetaceae bacterium]|nr:HNH endonuclease [Streptomycetaceae bacterium]
MVRPPVDIPPRADLGEWARIRSKIVVTDRDWIYCGALSDDGYGRFWVREAASGDDVVVRPSRWMWGAHHGPIPPGFVVRHECDLSLCCRPNCLRLGEQVDNVDDAWHRDRLTYPGRVGKADRRGAGGAARVIRDALLEAISEGVQEPAALGAVVTAARAAGDPYANTGTLIPDGEMPPRVAARAWAGRRGVPPAGRRLVSEPHDDQGEFFTPEQLMDWLAAQSGE